MAELVAGMLAGILIGLALRPLLDAYLIHRMSIDARSEAPDEPSVSSMSDLWVDHG